MRVKMEGSEEAVVRYLGLGRVSEAMARLLACSRAGSEG